MWAEFSAAGSTANKTPSCLQWGVRAKWGWPRACGLTLWAQEKEAPPGEAVALPTPAGAQQLSLLPKGPPTHFPRQDFPLLWNHWRSSFFFSSLRKNALQWNNCPHPPPKGFNFSLISLCMSLSSRFLPLEKTGISCPTTWDPSENAVHFGDVRIHSKFLKQLRIACYKIKVGKEKVAFPRPFPLSKT